MAVRYGGWDAAHEYGVKKGENSYRLSPEQAQAILELRLHRLTGLEQQKILKEYRDQLDIIVDLLDILNQPERLRQVIHDELMAIKEEFADPRRTEIISVDAEINEEDLHKFDLIFHEYLLLLFLYCLLENYFYLNFLINF